MRRLVRGLAAWAAIVLAATGPAAAQRDTVVVPGAEYRAGDLHRRLLGDDYRQLWTTPVRVPFLDLDRFAGGLTPVERGGGRQTRSLRMRGADGREYVFRSVNKYPLTADEPALEGTVVARLVRDQVSSIHPGAAPVVASLLDDVGVLHADPTILVMPDDPRLGEFRAEFAGTLGVVEERPDDAADGVPAFGGFPRIIGTDRLLERLEESPEDRLDARAYLAARLVDLFLNDWDRHADQWRWAQDDRGGTRWWLPIPRDRDYAFSDYDGLAMRLLRAGVRNAVAFGPRIDNLGGLVLNAREQDRRFLAGLERAAWDSVAVAVQSRLTDAAIDRAVSRMPREMQNLSAGALASDLRARRGDIPAVAAEYYEALAREVDVRATDEADLALVDRVADGLVEVRLYRREGDAAEPRGEPYFHRRFAGGETDEVRVYLHGGDDRAVVRGDVHGSLMVRVIGGGGDDVLVDSSTVRRDGGTAFYDDRGENRLVRGRQTAVDTRSWEPPASGHQLSGETDRDWGGGWAPVPVLDYRHLDGPIVGGGMARKRYGFRRQPYAHRYGATARVGLLSGNLGATLFGDFNLTASPLGYSFLLDATQLESFRFHGFGNDTESEGDRDRYIVEQHQVEARMALTLDLAGGSLGVGPVFKYTNPDTPDGFPPGALPRYGNAGFSQLGALVEGELDRRNDRSYPLHGARLRFHASGYPELFDATSAFGSARLEAATYLTPPYLPVTLALRAGGERAWGDFPAHESAFLGGSRSVRGYSFQRYAGDAALFGNAELRAPLAEAKLIVRGTLGGLVLADAGRVYYDGDASDGWHTAVGAGLWFLVQVRDGSYLVSGTYAVGEAGRIYLKLGVPF